MNLKNIMTLNIKMKTTHSKLLTKNMKWWNKKINNLWISIKHLLNLQKITNNKIYKIDNSLN